MVEDSLSKLVRELYKYLTGNEEIKGILIKKHSIDLHLQGEYCFPKAVTSWHKYIDIKSEVKLPTLLSNISKELINLTEESKNWILPLKQATESKDRVHLFLNRIHAIKVGLSDGLVNNNLILCALNTNIVIAEIDPRCEEQCITSLRLKCIKDFINNILRIFIKDVPELSNIIVTSKTSRKNCNKKLIVCGTVLNVETNAKETNLHAEDFISLRQNELKLIAEHRYGIRASKDCKWKNFITHLGEAAIAFELLKTKPSSAVKINFDGSSGSSKDAAFIIYNCARLETILRNYREKVEDGTYPPLPDFQDTDFSLLTQEDEWSLIFNYIMGLPPLLKTCITVNEHMCEFRPQVLCIFLRSMVKLISQYYRKTKILTEPRKHLLPVMFARLHMLNILNETLKNCLLILNIKSVSQM